MSRERRTREADGLYAPDPQAFVDVIERHGGRFDVHDSADPQRYRTPVARVRLRRGRLADGLATGTRDVSLVQRDGVLLWVFSDELGLGARTGPRRRRGRGRRARAELGGEEEVLKEVSIPVLEPNEYLGALAHTDQTLNKDCDQGLRLVKPVPQANGDLRFEAAGKPSKPLAGRSLLLVHGTFSSSRNTLDEYTATPDGRKFLSDALKRYGGQVLVFDHPTLSVSPFLNAIDLSRQIAGVRGELDVIAHSRGGVVVRWWLELLGASLGDVRVRALMVGAPLKGTSLAAPNRIHPMLSVLSNIGSFVAKTLTGVGAANPFALASVALLKFLVRREADRWGIPPVDDVGRRPDLDAAVAVIPGLQGQSAVSNNYELIRLRAPKQRVDAAYFAVTADFEPERIGWKLWKVISEASVRAPDAVADVIFPKANDLVVDTAHMTSLTDGDKRSALAALEIPKVLRFDGGQTEVHHLSYFRHPKTIAAFRDWLDFDRA